MEQEARAPLPLESMSEMKEAGAGPQHASLGDEIIGRINQLATISDTPEHLTRIFLTKEHRAAADLILSWMRDAGMRAHLEGCSACAEDRDSLRALLISESGPRS